MYAATETRGQRRMPERAAAPRASLASRAAAVDRRAVAPVGPASAHTARHPRGDGRDRAPEPARLQSIVDRIAEFVRNHPRLTIALATIAVVVGMLYGPARDWYVSVRSGQDLETYYAALEEQNALIREDLARLQTREGIEDEARLRGYINPDEVGVIVQNLPESEIEESDEIVVDYTTSWGTKLLDFLFGYTPGEWQ